MICNLFPITVFFDQYSYSSLGEREDLWSISRCKDFYFLSYSNVLSLIWYYSIASTFLNSSQTHFGYDQYYFDTYLNRIWSTSPNPYLQLSERISLTNCWNYPTMICTMFSSPYLSWVLYLLNCLNAWNNYSASSSLVSTHMLCLVSWRSTKTILFSPGRSRTSCLTKLMLILSIWYLENFHSMLTLGYWRWTPSVIRILSFRNPRIFQRFHQQHFSLVIFASAERHFDPEIMSLLECNKTKMRQIAVGLVFDSASNSQSGTFLIPICLSCWPASAVLRTWPISWGCSDSSRRLMTHYYSIPSCARPSTATHHPIPWSISVCWAFALRFGEALFHVSSNSSSIWPSPAHYTCLFWYQAPPVHSPIVIWKRVLSSLVFQNLEIQEQ